MVLTHENISQDPAFTEATGHPFSEEQITADGLIKVEVVSDREKEMSNGKELITGHIIKIPERSTGRSHVQSSKSTDALRCTSLPNFKNILSHDIRNLLAISEKTVD